MPWSGKENGKSKWIIQRKICTKYIEAEGYCYATEAGKAVIEQVRKDGLIFITARHEKNNQISVKVMKKLGIKYCYSYEEEWQPKNIIVIFRMYQLNFNENTNYVYKKYWNESKNHSVEQF